MLLALVTLAFENTDSSEATPSLIIPVFAYKYITTLKNIDL
jgi:hypothetical protein